MELITKNKIKIAYKEIIEYVDKKTGEIKQLYKIYANDEETGIQEQLLVKKDDYTKLNKGDQGQFIFDKNNVGCYLKGIMATK